MKAASLAALYLCCLGAVSAAAQMVGAPSPPPDVAAPTAAPILRAEGFSGPMGVAYDPSGDIFLVSNAPKGGFSNAGSGFISQLETNGQLRKLRWVEGLNSPKGMRVRDGRLYVADLEQIHVVNLAKGQIERSIQLPGAYNITDLAFDPDGAIYAVDAGRDLMTGALYLVSAQGDPRLVKRSDRLLRPSSIELVNGHLLVGSVLGGASLLRLDGEGRFIDLQVYPFERFARTEVRSADGISGVVFVRDTIVAVANTETGSIALLDVAPVPIPDPVARIEEEAKRQGVEFTAVLGELNKKRFPDGGRLLGPTTADPRVFVTHALNMPRKLAFDPKHNQLAVVEYEQNSVALVPVAGTATADKADMAFGAAGLFPASASAGQ